MTVLEKIWDILLVNANNEGTSHGYLLYKEARSVLFLLHEFKLAKRELGEIQICK